MILKFCFTTCIYVENMQKLATLGETGKNEWWLEVYTILMENNSIERQLLFISLCFLTQLNNYQNTMNNCTVTSA